MNIAKKMLIMLILVEVVLGAQVLVWRGATNIGSHWPSVDTLGAILTADGHIVVYDTVINSVAPHSIMHFLIIDTVTIDEIQTIQRFVGLGGRAILVGEQGPSTYNYINLILSDSHWDDSLGNIRCNYDVIHEYPPDTMEDYYLVVKCPYFGGDPVYSSHVDTVIAWWPSSYSILSPDSGTAKPFIWSRRHSYSSVYDSFAVMGVSTSYGDGQLIVLGEWIPTVIYSPFNTANWGDNRQFMRNLFTTNDRADSVWLSGTDSTFTIFLPGSTPFIAGSTYFSFESAAYGSWLRHACDWSYWHTDSSITIQYPDTCPMGVTFEVCVKLVPDATGETVLPTGEVCDSFTFDYTGIAEAATPEHFEISAYPNPFNSAVSISVSCHSRTSFCHSRESGNPARAIHELPLQIEIFDINGKHITEFLKNESIWRPLESVSSGIYLIRAINGTNSVSKRVLYIK